MIETKVKSKAPVRKRAPRKKPVEKAKVDSDMLMVYSLALVTGWINHEGLPSTEHDWELRNINSSAVDSIFKIATILAARYEKEVG